MGLYFSGYAGPFLQAEIVKVPTEVKKFGCEICKKQVWDHKEKFCPTHGTPHARYTVIEQHQETYGKDLVSLVKEKLMPASHLPTAEQFNVWLGNVSFLDRNTHLEEYDFLDISEVDIASEMKAFKSFFEKEIAELAKVYSKPLQIKWGVLTWKS
jgi:hypothetical protein